MLQAPVSDIQIVSLLQEQFPGYMAAEACSSILMTGMLTALMLHAALWSRPWTHQGRSSSSILPPLSMLCHPPCGGNTR